MLLIHGMNTRGSWQEQFGWRRAAARSLHPGVQLQVREIRPGVFSARRRRQLVERTARTIEELAGDADHVHLGLKPDVITHSFCTWLIVHALLAHRDLSIGRLVLMAVSSPATLTGTGFEGNTKAF
jgi:hypothetical protein